MRKKKILILLTVLISCRDRNIYQTYYDKASANSSDSSWTFMSNQIDSIPLDDKTAFFSYSLQYSDVQNDSALLTFISSNSNIKKDYNSIYIYNYDSKRLRKVLNFGHSVGSLRPPTAHLYVNDDSIYVYNENRGKLYLCNRNCAIVDSIATVNRKIDPFGAHPEPSTSNPMLHINRSVFIPSSLPRYRKTYKQYKTILRIDSSYKRYIVALPDVYNNGFWGERFKYLVSVCYNPFSEKIILSYPVDPFIYEANLDGEIVKRHYVGSSFFGAIPVMTNDVAHGTAINYNTSDGEIEYYSFTNSDFNRIMYDRYRNVYYRVALIRSVENGDPSKYTPDFSVIVLDSNFRKVSERKFDGNIFHPTMIFVSKEGLNIARQDLYKLNNNYLYFNSFKLSKT